MARPGNAAPNGPVQSEEENLAFREYLRDLIEEHYGGRVRVAAHAARRLSHTTMYDLLSGYARPTYETVYRLTVAFPEPENAKRLYELAKFPVPEGLRSNSRGSMELCPFGNEHENTEAQFCRDCARLYSAAKETGLLPGDILSVALEDWIENEHLAETFRPAKKKGGGKD